MTEFKVLGICESLDTAELFDSESYTECRDWLWRYVKHNDGGYPMIVVARYDNGELQSWTREYERREYHA